MATPRLLPAAQPKQSSNDTIPGMLPNTVRMHQLPVLIVALAILIVIGVQVTLHMHLTSVQFVALWIAYVIGILCIGLIRRANGRKTIIASECLIILTSSVL